jgi:hypothetical protein
VGCQADILFFLLQLLMQKFYTHLFVNFKTFFQFLRTIFLEIAPQIFFRIFCLTFCSRFF